MIPDHVLSNEMWYQTNAHKLMTVYYTHHIPSTRFCDFFGFSEVHYKG